MKMKDSGIYWAGKIPATWKVINNKYVMIKVKDIQPHYNNETILSLSMDGVIKRDFSKGGKFPKSFDGYQKLYKGNLLLCLFDIDVTPRCVGIINDNGLTSPAYSQFVLNNGYYLNYYYYLYLLLDFSKELVHFSKNLRYSLTEDQLGDFKVIVPPYEKQKLISEFLDKALARIDNLILKTKKSISNLQDYKESIITQTVTKGLDPDAEMKDSGIEWIGKSPLSWQIVKLKYIALLNNIKCNNRTYQYVGLENIESKSGRLIGELSFTPEGDSLLVKKDQIIFGKLRTYLAKCYLANKTYSCSTEFMVFTPFKVSPKFLKYMLLNSAVINEFKRVSYGAKMPRIDPDYVMYMKFILPYSMQEQIKITKYLDDKCGQIDKLITKKQNFISMLDEYKKSLIYEYVTGKKTVGEN